jgi:transposase
MTPLMGEHKIWLCTLDTDMRKSFTGLTALVTKVINQNPVTGDWFVFVNRRRTMMKVLYFAPGGYCVWCKQLFLN